LLLAAAWLSLILVLAVAWWNASAYFAAFLQPDYLGYALSGGIALSVIWLASTGQRWYNRGLRIALITVLMVAHMFTEYKVAYGQELTKVGLVSLNFLEGVVLLGRDLVIALLAMAASEYVAAAAVAPEAERPTAAPVSAALPEPTPVSAQAPEEETPVLATIPPREAEPVTEGESVEVTRGSRRRR